MTRMVDVLLSPEELAALGKKNTSCMKLDPRNLAPAMCVSKAGVASAAMFGGIAKTAGAHSEAREMSVAQYAQLFEKYYGNGSLVEKLVASNKAQADAARDATVDAEITKRALRETRAKYLTPRLAGLHNVEAAGITGPPPASPPVLGLLLVPQQQQQQGGNQPEAGSAKLTEMANQLVHAQAAREAAAVAAEAKRAKELRRQVAANSRRVDQETSSFRTATRDQARRTGSKFVEGGQSAPGPGKYDVKWSYWDKAKPSPMIVPPDYKSEVKALLIKKAARAAQQEEEDIHNGRHASRAATRSAAQTHVTHVTRAQSARTHVTRAQSAKSHFGVGSASHYGGDLTAAPSSLGREQSGADSRPGTARSHRSASMKRPGTAPSGGHHRETHHDTYLKMFKDAHHVHDKREAAAGTSSFKAASRPALSPETAASHLALKYHHDGIDACTRKTPLMVLPFSGQPPRQGPTTGSDTPAALGPGAYIGQDNMPTSWTGRGVQAGHVGIRHAPDFARTGPRPQSAVGQQTGPLGHVGQAEAGRALQALFGDSLNPSELISVQNLQAVSGVETQYHNPQGRPMSAMVAGSQVRSASAHQQRPYSARAAMVVAERTAATAFGERPPSAGVQGGDGGVYPLSGHVQGSGDQGRYGSWIAGSSRDKRVQGGPFPRTTRAQEIQGLRVVSDGKVIPPASAPLAKIRPSQAADVMYNAVPDTVMGHHPRTPSWQLPPNRAALSKQWVSAAALAYL